MIKRLERKKLREIHSSTNPEISYEMFEWNYGWLEVEKKNTLIILENGKKVLEFTYGGAYFDKRKPNERQTTD